MEFVFLGGILFVMLVVPPDPAAGVWRTKARARNLTCERVDTDAGSLRYPGQIVASPPRGDDTEGEVVVCTERMTRLGLRPARDEAILESLDARAADLATAAESLRPDLRDRTWLVESWYPSLPVSTKISFAAKNALMRRGLTVSDRTPTLAVADVHILSRMRTDEAYSTACQRYAATGTLGEGDVLLAVVSRDDRETILHAGLCADGSWTWLK